MGKQADGMPKRKRRRTRCSGPDRHIKACRPHRPLCSWQAKVLPRYRVCVCGVYWFPHRTGSGLCGNPEKAFERYMGPCEEHDAVEPEGEVDLSFDVG